MAQQEDPGLTSSRRHKEPTSTCAVSPSAGDLGPGQQPPQPGAAPRRVKEAGTWPHPSHCGVSGLEGGMEGGMDCKSTELWSEERGNRVPQQAPQPLGPVPQRGASQHLALKGKVWNRRERKIRSERAHSSWNQRTHTTRKHTY